MMTRALPLLSQSPTPVSIATAMAATPATAGAVLHLNDISMQPAVATPTARSVVMTLDGM
jgi:hypothetical protein